MTRKKTDNDCAETKYLLVCISMLPEKIAFVDIETTGTSLTSDRIIEIGIVRVENNTVTKTFQALATIILIVLSNDTAFLVRIATVLLMMHRCYGIFFSYCNKNFLPKI